MSLIRRFTSLSSIYNSSWSRILSASDRTWMDRLINRHKSEQGDRTTPPASNDDTSKSTAEGTGGGSGQENESHPLNVDALKDKVKEVEEMLARKDKESIEMKDKYLRALAEVENTRERMLKQVKDSKLFGIQEFSKDILDVADILEKAMVSVPPNELEQGINPSLLTLFTGLKMTESELQKVFKKNGLVRIDPSGQLFDPNYHEALFEIPGEPPGTVASVTKVGYTLNGRTIRPALVGVFKREEAGPTSNSDQNDK